REATRESMREITGALVGIAVVLSAVFLPMAFFGGATGIIYRQFSVTLVAAMMLSLFVALTLTPALCAQLLRTQDAAHTASRRGFFGAFNRLVDRSRERYVSAASRMIPRRMLWLGVYGLICVGIWVLFQRTPTAFLPDEDQGRVAALYMLPEGSTLEQTAEVADRVAEYLLEAEKDSIIGVFAVPGFSSSGNGQSQGQAFAVLKDWRE